MEGKKSEENNWKEEIFGCQLGMILNRQQHLTHIYTDYLSESSSPSSLTSSLFFLWT